LATSASEKRNSFVLNRPTCFRAARPSRSVGSGGGAVVCAAATAAAAAAGASAAGAARARPEPISASAVAAVEPAVRNRRRQPRRGSAAAASSSAGAASPLRGGEHICGSAARVQAGSSELRRAGAGPSSSEVGSSALSATRQMVELMLILYRTTLCFFFVRSVPS